MLKGNARKRPGEASSTEARGQGRSRGGAEEALYPEGGGGKGGVMKSFLHPPRPEEARSA